VADRIYVKGLKEMRGALRNLGPEFVKELQRENKAVANEIGQEAGRAFAAAHPGGSGRSAATYRGLATQTSAKVAAGSARRLHVLGFDFGSNQGKNKKQFPPYVKGGRFLYPTIQRRSADLPERYGKVLDKVGRPVFPGGSR